VHSRSGYQLALLMDFRFEKPTGGRLAARIVEKENPDLALQ
jgi:hypothetical protein